MSPKPSLRRFPASFSKPVRSDHQSVPKAPAALSVCLSLCPLPDKYREYSRGSIPSFKAYGAAWAQSCQNPGADQQGRNLGVFCPKLAMNDRLSSLGVNSTSLENTFLFSFSQKGLTDAPLCLSFPLLRSPSQRSETSSHFTYNRALKFFYIYLPRLHI